MDNTIEMLQDKIQRLEQETNELRQKWLHALSKISQSSTHIDDPESMEGIDTIAYCLVFCELLQIGYLVGKYDADNANEYFVMGAQSVMEEIAARISEECYTEYLAIVKKNTAESKKLMNR